MKSLSLLALGLSVLLLGSGCQPARLSSSDMQQFGASLKNASPEEEPALRCAQYYNLVGRADLALNELNRALDVYPNSVRLLNAVGGCFDRLGNYAQAQQMYERALAQDAKNNLLRNNLGYSCYLSGDLDRAEKIFQEVLAQCPDDTLARNNLGLLWCRQGKEKGALNLWQKTDGDLQAREKLQQVLAYLGKPVEKTTIGTSAGKDKPPKTSVDLPNHAAKPPEPQAQLTEIAQSPQRSANPRPSPLPAAAPQPAPVKNSTRTPGKASPDPHVKVEEVEMVIQPASYSPPPAGLNPASQADTLIHQAPAVRAPGSAPGKTRQLSAVPSVTDPDLLPDYVGPPRQPRYYRRPQWQRIRQPQIITCPPQEPQKSNNPVNKYLSQESTYQPQKSSGRQETMCLLTGERQCNQAYYLGRRSLTPSLVRRILPSFPMSYLRGGLGSNEG